MTEYALLRAVARHGRTGAVLLALAAGGAIFWMGFAALSWSAAALAAICAALVYVALASYADLVKLTIEMLLPRR